jgi:hypothetical protein
MQYISRVLASTLLLLISVSAHAQIETCGVPVCDVEAYVLELREAPNQQREQKILQQFPAFVEEHRRSKDVQIWSNLAELAEKTYALVVELEDPDYILREAANLSDVAQLGLHRYGPTTVENLFNTYAKLASSGRRFEALSSWDQLEKEESVAKVQAIIDFAVRAAELSQSLDDPDWVIEKARQLASAGSVRISNLDPIAEGYYRISMTRDPQFPTLCGDLGVDTLMVANWMNSEGLVAMLYSRSADFHKAYFKNMVISDAASRVRVRSISFGTSSRIAISLNKETGKVSGTFTSTRHGCTYRFEGQRVHSPGLYLRDGELNLPEIPSIESVKGIYEATLIPENDEGESGRPIRGQMVIRPHEQPNGSRIAASFVSPSFTQDFQFGYVVGQRAFMVFNSGTGENNLIRWDMAYRPDANGNWAWRGRMMSFFNGRMARLILKKISDYGPGEEEAESDEP